MESGNSSPSQERYPDFSGEQLPESPEVPRRSPEERETERSAEGRIEQQSQAPVQQPIVVPQLPTPMVPNGSDDSADSSEVPTVAAHQDVIEKEWVERAKKIIADTKNDPLRRDQEVTRLKASYLDKRFDKKLGEAT